ncbi:ABC transporter permease [Algoriphagus aestuariicola]|uniref:ABC transporter permease n=1 Tax=Algoriphagus aestuariicola TaxID=1852016 RepID=A0ABS3BR38_9BACT|nr:ABC transporter permease [Algoriphagus aestuariicola]MBN7801517.1 ABC transporter permease [Algoriphagus aestuariicola]
MTSVLSAEGQKKSLTYIGFIEKWAFGTKSTFFSGLSLASSLEIESSQPMFRNHLVTALRTLLRERANSLTNIAGLTLGITGSLLLFLIVRQGLQFDQHHSQKDRIYRVVSGENGPNGQTFVQAVPAVLAAELRAEIPEIQEAVATVYKRNSLLGVVRPDGTVDRFKEKNGVVFTENSFFRIFDRKILAGDAAKVLIEPQKALISVRWAEKYFGTREVIGREILYNNESYQIEGVLEDFPTTTDLPFDLMLSFESIREQKESVGWGGLSDEDNCYFLLNQNSGIGSVEAGLEALVQKNYGKGKENTNGNHFIIQPLAELHSDMRVGNYNSKMPAAAKIAFTGIGLFLLLTCCINFINLTTASAVKRTKEIGIRKVLGSTRAQLITQILSESLLATFAACLLSLLAAQLLIPIFNGYLELSLSLSLTTDWGIWVYFLVIWLGVTLLSGLYPAWVISGMRQGHVIHGNTSTKGSGYTIRRTLIVSQFFISQFFIISTLVIYAQFRYMQKKDMGFVQDAIVNIPIPASAAQSDAPQDKSKKRTLKSELMRIPGVESASLSSTPPAANSVLSTSISLSGSDEPIATQIKEADGDYIALFGLEILAGTGLADLDTLNSIVVNESLAKSAGFQDYSDFVGQEIDLWGNLLHVNGVVKDFNSTSPGDNPAPLLLMNNLDGYKTISLKLTGGQVEQQLSQIEDIWEGAYPEHLFEYSFARDDVNNLFRGERKTTSVLAFFAGIAIFIGCLGSFGLATFMANNRQKEVGVRKVLGASASSIVWLFSKEFIRLILIAFALSMSIAWFTMDKVLQEFAYRIALGPSLFLAALALSILIVLLSVSYRSVQAALANPVDTLHAE